LCFGSTFVGGTTNYILGSFTSESSCESHTLNGVALTVPAGECTLNAPDSTYFQILSLENSSAANIHFGCSSNCDSCDVNINVSFGRCINFSNGIYGELFGEHGGTLSPSLFTDPDCSNPSEYPFYLNIPSGQCSAANGIKDYYWASNLGGDYFAYGSGCESDCKSCNYFGFPTYGECVQMRRSIGSKWDVIGMGILPSPSLYFILWLLLYIHSRG